MEWLVIICYTLSMLIICLFSLEQLYLTFQYRKAKKASRTPEKLQHFPHVTVQLPIFNEKYVVKRLIDKVCEMDYPSDKLEIQVLDDSTDDTTTIATESISEWKEKGVNIQLVRRTERTGFKAGALQYGLELVSGEFIAIFDSDFLPHPDFLLKTLPAFQENTGMVQTRWEHLNQHYSLLTEMQAFGLNAHFTIEQTGRNSSGKLMNFNGTAGIWRKSCIQDAGGWQHDTLTEDLDLSYRAQMKGWEFKYLEEVTAPAELPVLVPAIKSQQYRWNKGAAETARKNLKSIIKSNLTTHQKIHAGMHLLNSSVFVFLLIAAALSIPMLYIKKAHPELNIFFNMASVFIVGFIAMSIFYWVASKSITPNLSFWTYCYKFPLFLTFSMGMALHNAIAVTEGFSGRKTPFIRTPKFNITSKTDSWKKNIYLPKNITSTTWIEGLFSLYFLFGIYSGFQLQDFGLMVFHLLLFLGFGSVFILSISPKLIYAAKVK